MKRTFIMLLPVLLLTISCSNKQENKSNTSSGSTNAAKEKYTHAAELGLKGHPRGMTETVCWDISDAKDNWACLDDEGKTIDKKYVFRSDGNIDTLYLYFRDGEWQDFFQYSYKNNINIGMVKYFTWPKNGKTYFNRTQQGDNKYILEAYDLRYNPDTSDQPFIKTTYFIANDNRPIKEVFESNTTHRVIKTTYTYSGDTITKAEINDVNNKLESNEVSIVLEKDDHGNPMRILRETTQKDNKEMTMVYRTYEYY